MDQKTHLILFVEALSNFETALREEDREREKAYLSSSIPAWNNFNEARKKSDRLRGVVIEAFTNLLEKKAKPSDPLTKADLANALDCFWNASIGAAHNAQDSTSFSVIGCMAEGISSIARRLRED